MNKEMENMKKLRQNLYKAQLESQVEYKQMNYKNIDRRTSNEDEAIRMNQKDINVNLRKAYANNDLTLYSLIPGIKNNYISNPYKVREKKANLSFAENPSNNFSLNDSTSYEEKRNWSKERTRFTQAGINSSKKS